MINLFLCYMKGLMKKSWDYATFYNDENNNRNYAYIVLRWMHTVAQAGIGIWITLFGTYVWYTNNIKKIEQTYPHTSLSNHDQDDQSIDNKSVM